MFLFYLKVYCLGPPIKNISIFNLGGIFESLSSQEFPKSVFYVHTLTTIFEANVSSRPFLCSGEL